MLVCQWPAAPLEWRAHPARILTASNTGCACALQAELKEAPRLFLSTSSGQHRSLKQAARIDAEFEVTSPQGASEEDARQALRETVGQVRPAMQSLCMRPCARSRAYCPSITWEFPPCAVLASPGNCLGDKLSSMCVHIGDAGRAKPNGPFKPCA